MAFDREHLKITFGFFIVGTDETASTGIKYSGGPGYAAAEADLALIATADDGDILLASLDDAMDGTNFGWADYSRLSSVRIAAVKTDGSEYEATYEASLVTPHAGAFTLVAPQLSVVVSLRSGETTGRANFGKMYLPHCRPLLQSGTPFISTSEADQIAVAMKSCINEWTATVNAGALTPLLPVIMSSVGAGTTKPVTQVQIGNVTDTQRRRRKQLPEVYSSETL